MATPSTLLRSRIRRRASPAGPRDGLRWCLPRCVLHVVAVALAVSPAPPSLARGAYQVAKRRAPACRVSAAPRTTQATEEQLLGFQQLFSQFTAEKGGLIDWSLIKPPPEEMIAMHANLAEPTADELAGEMQKLAVLKLNGGLGTGMGCKGCVRGPTLTLEGTGREEREDAASPMPHPHT